MCREQVGQASLTPEVKCPAWTMSVSGFTPHLWGRLREKIETTGGRKEGLTATENSTCTMKEGEDPGQDKRVPGPP